MQNPTLRRIPDSLLIFLLGALNAVAEQSGAKGLLDADRARLERVFARGLSEISSGLGTLDAALSDVESQHLRPLEPAVKAINAQFDVILSALPGIARKAAVVAERRPR